MIVDKSTAGDEGIVFDTVVIRDTDYFIRFGDNSLKRRLQLHLIGTGDCFFRSWDEKRSRERFFLQG